MEVKKWDIYWAEVEYENFMFGKKTRPVLVVSENNYLFVDVVTITSKNKREEKDYEIIEWQSAGLKKPSVIRFSKKHTYNIKDLKEKIGRLSNKDIALIATKVLKK